MTDRTSRKIEKKKAERRHLNAFRRRCGDFPFGRIISGETPDFIVVRGSLSRRIGIEHTRVLVDDGRRRGSIQEREAVKNNVTRLAEELFQKYKLPEVYVILFFSRGCELKKGDAKNIAQAVAETVRCNLPSEGKYCRVEYRIGSGQPIEVDLIWIARMDFGSKHWMWQEAGEVHRNAIKQLQRAIAEKARTIKGCLSKCDECWLLIVAPSQTPAGFIEPNDISLEHVYHSVFGKTWFLDDFSGKVVRLNTIFPK